MAHDLILLRHAKSDWDSSHDDFDRPLNTRGQHDAPRIGQWLREHGVGLDVSLTQFGQAMASPDEGNNHLQYGGKLNAKFAFDVARLGLWEGLSANAHIEYKYEHSVNGFNGVLLPINTQIYEPANTD